jgi:hypothetical protein
VCQLCFDSKVCSMPCIASSRAMSQSREISPAVARPRCLCAQHHRHDLRASTTCMKNGMSKACTRALSNCQMHSRRAAGLGLFACPTSWTPTKGQRELCAHIQDHSQCSSLKNSFYGLFGCLWRLNPACSLRTASVDSYASHRGALAHRSLPSAGEF